MHDPADFDRRLTDALGRYAERAPVASDPIDVALTAMGPADRVTRRWSFPRPRSLSLVLLVGLLLLSMLAVVAGVGGRLIREDPLAVAVPTATPAGTASTGPTSSPSPAAVIGDGETWIAFMASYDSKLIEAVRPDGTGRHRLFPLVPGGEQQHPDWSPDGQRVVFSVIGTETQVLWTGDADGSETSLTVDCQAPCQWVDEPAWSPDGGSIAYHRMVSNDGVGVSTLEILAVASGQTRIVYTAPAARAVYAPRWSGDGSHIVFELVTMESFAFDSEVTGVVLAVVDLAETTPTPREITAPDLRCNNPDWSWVNDLIVCTRPTASTGFEGPADLYTIQPDGTGLAALTAVAASGDDAIKPTWLPDGSGVIFSDSDGNMRTILADGSGLAPAVSGDPVLGLHARFRPTP
jgi:Tol biopolymer transport system component